MRVTITPGKLHGSIKAIASKSAAHRLLISAALADRPTYILCEELSGDIESTAKSLNQIGANIRYDQKNSMFHVIPIHRHHDPGKDPVPGRGDKKQVEEETVHPQKEPHNEAEDAIRASCGTGKRVLDVGESGSTLRFLLPVVCSLGIDTHIVMHGRLPKRPLSPLLEELERHGCHFIRNRDGSVDTEGKLCGGEFRMAADVSSQFISGLLFALPLLEEPSRIRLYGPVESESYIRMTIRALEQFGICTVWDGDVLTVSAAGGERDPDRKAANSRNLTARAGYISPGTVRTEGDWSNGAFWEIAGMLTDGGAGSLICTGLNEASIQGDRAVRELKMMITAGNAAVDVRDVPDLVPVLSVLAASTPGTTAFTHAGRLRLKESNRIRSTVDMLRALGANAEETADGLIVHGTEQLKGGFVDSCNDHRIAMSAAVASVACKDKVVIDGAEAVGKSYPAFWEDFERLGGQFFCEP